MHFLINFSLLKLPNNFHIFFANRILFEIIEFGGIIREIKKIDSALMLLIKFLNVLLDIEIVTD